VLAASVQAVLEEVLIDLCGWLYSSDRQQPAGVGRRRRTELRRQHAAARREPVQRNLGATRAGDSGTA
jgi:hypothetical protein